MNSDSFILEKKREILLYKILYKNNNNIKKNNNISKIIDIDLDKYRYIYGEILLKKEDFRKKFKSLFKKEWEKSLNYSKLVLNKNNNISNFNNLKIDYTNNKILSNNNYLDNILILDDLLLFNYPKNFNLYKLK